MYIFKKQKDLSEYLNFHKNTSVSIGFVPTMGALHQGHISLVDDAKKINNLVVCSIFVNPTQFNNIEDLAKYPKTIDSDIEMLTTAGCDVLYLPEKDDIYPNGITLNQKYDLGYLETVFEGSSRPGHFQGVAQVVDILLQIVQPDDLYLGQKDYQQCMVLTKLLSLKNYSTAIHKVPTLRDDDGLAMSSRNRRLLPAERAVANTIYQCLISMQAKKEDGDFNIVKKECEDLLIHKGFTPDYIHLADADTLEILEEYDNKRRMVALIAAYLGDVRLIDNIIIN